MDVTEFGAKGDGTTDDTAAFNAAFSAAAGAGGKTVRIPAPAVAYLITSRLEVAPGVHVYAEPLVGDDANTKFHIRFSGTVAAFSFASNRATLVPPPKNTFHQGTTVQNLRLIYTGRASNVDGFLVDYASVVFSNTWAEGFTGHGYDIEVAIFSSFYDIRAAHNVGSGVYVRSHDPSFPNGQIVFVNPTIGYNGTPAMKLENVMTLQILGGTIWGSRDEQLVLAGATNVTVQNVNFEPFIGDRTGDTNERLIRLTGWSGGDVTYPSGTVTITGCSLEGAGAGAPSFAYGIEIGNASNVRISSNRFGHFTAGSINTVLERASAAQGVVIEGNFRYGTAGPSFGGSASIAYSDEFGAAFPIRDSAGSPTTSGQNVTAMYPFFNPAGHDSGGHYPAWYDSSLPGFRGYAYKDPAGNLDLTHASGAGVKLKSGGGATAVIAVAEAAPVAGTWTAGSQVWNSAPAVGRPRGWVCVAGGTPGTWVTMGNL